MKTANNNYKESLHEQNPRGFMATHSTNEDKGLTIYYDGMPGGQERTIDFAQTLVKDGYDIEWSNNESNLKENQDEKLNTPKEKIQETAQQSRGTTNTMDKREKDRSPDANTGIEEGEVKVEG